MLKTIILASSMIVATPLLAQSAPQTKSTTTTKTTTTMQKAPVTGSAPAPAAADVVAADAATAASTATPKVATSQDQVAEAVGREWPTYDKDANDQLSQAEFTSWIVALRKAAEPGFAPASPEAQAWQTQAFAVADADKSASVSKAELTTFLTPKAS